MEVFLKYFREYWKIIKSLESLTIYQAHRKFSSYCAFIKRHIKTYRIFTIFTFLCVWIDISTESTYIKICALLHHMYIEMRTRRIKSLEKLFFSPAPNPTYQASCSTLCGLLTRSTPSYRLYYRYIFCDIHFFEHFFLTLFYYINDMYHLRCYT